MENIAMDKRTVSNNRRSSGKGGDVAKHGPAINTPAAVLIEWLDAEHEFGWQDGNELDEDEPVLNCLTIGWLMKETKTHVKVCQTLTMDNHAQTLVIPRGMIVSITILQQPQKRYATISKR